MPRVSSHALLRLSLASLLLAAAATIALARPDQAPAGGTSARASLADASGRSVGEATLVQTPNGVLIHARLSGLPPGTHAFHVHDRGVCTPPFESAGPHFAPGPSEHGFLATRAPHPGDLPNIHVPAGGALDTELMAPGLVLHGKQGVMDRDGAALVIHERPDDYRSQPAGDAGARIACGVIAP